MGAPDGKGVAAAVVPITRAVIRTVGRSPRFEEQAVALASGDARRADDWTHPAEWTAAREEDFSSYTRVAGKDGRPQYLVKTEEGGERPALVVLFSIAPDNQSAELLAVRVADPDDESELEPECADDEPT